MQVFLLFPRADVAQERGSVLCNIREAAVSSVFWHQPVTPPEPAAAGRHLNKDTTGRPESPESAQTYRITQSLQLVYTHYI